MIVKTVLERSSCNTHTATQDNYYNPLPTLDIGYRFEINIDAYINNIIIIFSLNLCSPLSCRSG